MVEYNVNRYIKIIGGIAILSFIMFFFLFKLSVSESISWSISVVTLFVVSFIFFAWKWKIFRKWLVPFPNLNGQWSGSICSSHDGFCKTIPIKIVIKQSFLYIQVKLHTGESQSNSIMAAFNIDNKRDIIQLGYLYQNDSKAKYQEKSPIHYGSVLFDIKSDNKMEGRYWTERMTHGDISINRVIAVKK